MKKSIENGNRCEKEAQKLFRQFGFWAHILSKGNDGSQPVDIVAIRGSESWLVDSKSVEREASFSFDEIRPNQWTSLGYAKDFAKIKNLGFVIFFGRDFDNPRFLPYDMAVMLRNMGAKSVGIDQLEPFKSKLGSLQN